MDCSGSLRIFPDENRPWGGGEFSERANVTYGILQESVLSGYFLSRLCKNVCKFKGIGADGVFYRSPLAEALKNTV